MTTRQTPARRYIAVVPAAGIGSRMQLEQPKQYLQLAGKTILEHSVAALLAEPRIQAVVVALHVEDDQFSQLPLAQDPRLHTVVGGASRASSVTSALRYLVQHWPHAHAVVHDAARPCLQRSDLARLLDTVTEFPDQGALLAYPVRDTMKRSTVQQRVLQTVSREYLWHALTPQVFSATALLDVLLKAEQAKVEITDEASAMEWAGGQPHLVSGRSSNIKVTQPDDLDFVDVWLQQFIGNQ